MSKKRNRNKLSKKRHGRPKIVADAQRSSAKRKRSRTKKQLRKRKRVKNFCTIFRGQRKFLDCGHVLPRWCFKSWRRGNAPTCPICRRKISRNTVRRHQPNLETRNDHSQNSPREFQIRNGDYFVVTNNPSPNADNFNMDVNAQYPVVDNLIIDVDDQSLDSDYSFETRSSQVTFSDLLQDQPGLSIDPSPNLNIPKRGLSRSSRVLGNSSVEVPVLFIPVLCCGHQVDSDANPQQGSLESNEHIRSGVLWDDAELHRHIRLLRIFLKDRDFTFNVLNSPAELDRDLLLYSHRRYITSSGWRRLDPSSSDEDEINVVD